jgi:hypothetical protein
MFNIRMSTTMHIVILEVFCLRLDQLAYHNNSNQTVLGWVGNRKKQPENEIASRISPGSNQKSYIPKAIVRDKISTIYFSKYASAS